MDQNMQKEHIASSASGPVEYQEITHDKIPPLPEANAGEVLHTGSCHCGAVQFCVAASPNIKAINCNCSICKKKQNIHFIVPEKKFSLIQGADKLTTYTFNTHSARHMFCQICGVQSFYRPRSNPDGYGVMPHCLDPETVKSVEIEYFDGQNWEDAINNSEIPSRSKVN